MKTTELRDNIIQKVLQSNDDQLLGYLNQLLSEGNRDEIYNLTDFEKGLISESLTDYKLGKEISNEDIISRNEKWLKE